MYTSKTTLKKIHFYIECRIREYNTAIQENKIYDSYYKIAEIRLLTDFIKKVCKVRAVIGFNKNTKTIAKLNIIKNLSDKQKLELESVFEDEGEGQNESIHDNL